MQPEACTAGAAAGAQASVMTPFAIAVFVMTLNSSAASSLSQPATMALATPPRSEDLPVAPVPAPPTAVAA